MPLRLLLHWVRARRADNVPPLPAPSADLAIDATQKGGTARFINHSCEPNCATAKWQVHP